MTNLRMQLFLGHVTEFHSECFSGNKINNSVIESCLKYNERNPREGSGYKNKFTDSKEEKHQKILQIYQKKNTVRQNRSFVKTNIFIQRVKHITLHSTLKSRSRSEFVIIVAKRVSFSGTGQVTNSAETSNFGSPSKLYERNTYVDCRWKL